MKKVINKVKFGIMCIFGTHMGRLLLLFVLMIASNSIHVNSESNMGYDIGNWAFMISSGLLLLYVLTFIIFAWIINPIRAYKEYLEDKKHQNR